MDLLSPSVLLRAYRAGLFPMADAERGGHIGLYRADPRAIIPIERFRVPRSVARAMRTRPFEVRLDTAFAEVVRACAEGREDGVWLTEELAGAYERLHRAGIAHSVECWTHDRLVGGLFGVALGGLFTSESMFHRADDAGNQALVAAGRHLVSRGFVLWDIQMASPHTERFGARLISADDYDRRLEAALAVECSFGPDALGPETRRAEDRPAGRSDG